MRFRKRGLAGAGRAEKGEELTLADGEGEVIDSSNAGTAHGVMPGDVFELDGGIG
jgi:hypothetical protein